MISRYTLYVIVEGPGDSDQHRSHWSFAFHRPGTTVANVLQVLLLDDKHLIYHFDRRDGVPFPIIGAEGTIRLGEFDASQYSAAQQTIEREPPPRNGKDRCQDWVLNCVIAMEVAEVLEPRSAELVGGCVGLGVNAVKEKVGSRWVVA